MVLNSFDEWSPLQEVIVGTASGLTAYHFDFTFKAFHWDNVQQFVKSRRFAEAPWPSVCGSPVVPLESKIVDELQQDIHEFVCALEALGVRVLRASATDIGSPITTPFWSSLPYSALNIRDQTIILGQTIVETATHVRGRLFENDALKQVFYEYFGQGARWIAMPRPTLAKGSVDVSYHSTGTSESFSPHLIEDAASPLLPQLTEIIFDGAQCLRFGEDILINVANSNHRLGATWLQREFHGTFRFHLLDSVSDGHIDSLFMPLRPGTLLVRHKDIVDKLPKAFRSWDLIEAPAPEKDLFPDYSQSSLAIGSKYIDLNVLSVAPDIVVVNSLYPELVRVLESHHFTVVPVRHRHRRIAGGGFHCFTLDTVRDSSLQRYI